MEHDKLPQLPFLLPSLPLEKQIQSRQQECEHILALIEFLSYTCAGFLQIKNNSAAVRLRVSELCSDGLKNTNQKCWKVIWQHVSRALENIHFVVVS